MTDNNIKTQSLYNDFVARESKSVQREQAVTEIQVSVLKEASQGNNIVLDQALQLTSSGTNLQSAEKTAKAQIEKGYLDVKV